MTTVDRTVPFADLAVHQLLAPGPVREGHGVVLVGEQGEGQRMLGGEGRQGLGGVGGDAQDLEACALEGGEAVAEVAGLGGAAGGGGAGVEVDNDVLAAVIGQGNPVARGVGQREAGCWSSAV